MNVLAIDTSTYVLSVALIKDGLVIGEHMTNTKINHSLRAMPAIEKVMEECQMKPKDLHRIVVAHGPGSYTGVRIGVTIAKTLAWSLNIPLVGVSSLKLMAANGRYFSGLICPLMDARRGQVYTGLYEWENENLIEKLEDVNVDLQNWLDQLAALNSEILFIGNDVQLHKEVIIEKLAKRAIFATGAQLNSRPGDLAILGMNEEVLDLHTFVPNYTRLAEAEAKWLENNQTK
ncbi:tRNA (adenosine(37)-N6)-threonylcarbamoyltransferase complex dimerization subunit type 1 TsaB [Sutcliffiella cohnii]|uniref:tRNA (adenosine(37)-N6)-threonylcarbamoyltransferase complex dimerization subunit type 1 TsaB n=1 Tax=Sutcliffiella cohnii TaxID=33932 RepID=UPI002E1A7C40|nr:tRNA (adenosine(37)-N6)-threonylcarbamoyltransferase complex dimerization subunit type 1 TsaB [Sutcliffiella cohnii]MED4017610.1 tRNA (adenosine(37)-N6)-threonylcarbamoyltransferase complex dimerization subunit type 1 TsaB [Sutcliffiella cohnii]